MPDRDYLFYELIISKRLLRLHQSTGELFVFPLIFGMAVGRIGCFLTRLSDAIQVACIAGIIVSLHWLSRSKAKHAP